MKKLISIAFILLFASFTDSDLQSQSTIYSVKMMIDDSTGGCTSCTGTLRKNESTGKSFCNGAPKDCNFSSGD